MKGCISFCEIAQVQNWGSVQFCKMDWSEMKAAFSFFGKKNGSVQTEGYQGEDYYPKTLNTHIYLIFETTLSRWHATCWSWPSPVWPFDLVYYVNYGIIVVEG